MKHVLIGIQRMAVAVLLAGLSATSGSAAGPVVLVKDLDAHVTPLDSNPRHFAEAGGQVYFVAENTANGRELWKASTSGGSATLVRDIALGSTNSQIALMASTGSRVVFSTSPPYGLAGLWTSDGTAEGTRHVRTIPIHGMAAVSDTVVFASNSALWRTDGTEAGTQLLRQFDSLATTFTHYNGRLFFVASDSVSGREIWSTDGTASGTRLLKEMTPGAATPGISTPQVSDGRLVFLISNQIWASDGTDAGTRGLASLPGTLVSGPALVGGRVLYIVEQPDIFGPQTWLWSSDGTAGGTAPMLQLGPPGTDSGIYGLVSANGRTFFGVAGPGGTRQLWASDGTSGGTQPIATFTPTPVTSQTLNGLRNINNRLFFVGSSGQQRNRLWTSDGTNAGTVLFHTVSFEDRFGLPILFDPVEGDGSFYFQGNGGAGLEPWRSDGTPEGTLQLGNIAADNQGAFDIHTLRPVVSRGQLIFTAWVNTMGIAIWRSNGTEEGTRLVQRIRYDITEGAPANLTSALGAVFFTASEPPPNSIGLSRQLWKTNGTAAGTQMLKLFNPQGNTVNAPHNLTEAGGKLFFGAEHEQYGGELWVSDGTPAGTRMVKDIAPGRPSGGAGHITAIGHRVFFTNMNSDTTSRLWVSDGTEAGTRMVKSLIGSGHYIEQMLSWQGRLFFTTKSSDGVGLWQSDGTEAGTTMVTLLDVSAAVSLVLSGDRLFFRARTDDAGRELWVSDGTAEGTHMVKDIWPGPSDGNPGGLSAGRSGEVFFWANDGQRGDELWKSDGTEAGTRLIKELNPGPASSFDSYSSMAATLPAGRVAFVAATPHTGVELWESDGTEAGTRLLADLAPGPASSNPRWLSLAGNALFFIADDNRTGQELWAVTGLGHRPGIFLR